MNDRIFNKCSHDFRLIADDIKGIAKVWILGDNFLAETYRKFFKKNNSSEFYLKQQFEVVPFCSSKYSERNSNTLSRIVNSFMQALNSKFHLPQYIVVLLDDDLIEQLQYRKIGAASLLGPWIEYLADLINSSLQTRREQLLPKARLPDKTQVYWVELVNHENFDYINQQICEVFGQCIEANCKLYDNMRILKIRDFWDKKDDNLVLNDKCTKTGLSVYWKSLDASFKFNIKKRDDYLVREKFRSMRSRTSDCVSRESAKRPFPDGKRARPDRSDFAMTQDQEDLPFDHSDMLDFFRSHWNSDFDRFRWRRASSQNDRFLLPKPRHTC